ncbi:MAG: FAD-dependent oxidoreductase, partial [Oscillospiraceae bacterium]|nr:FAD-dependent oxidoreductase [Oscillospiraceae bacterium]
MKYLIIGNSAGGIGAAEGIRQVDKEGEITIISSEPYHTYSRPLISYLLLGKITEDKRKYRDGDFYVKNNVRLVHGTVKRIFTENKQVILSGGEQMSYDKLLVATGSSPFVPPFEGLDGVKNKFTFMSLDDALSLNKALGKDKKVLIIGAGLIGLKCAEGILEKVAGITVVDLAARILSSILDDYGAMPVMEMFESKGVEFRLSKGVKRFEGNTAVLDDGERIDFDILVLAVGVRPNTALLKDIAKTDKGILINDKSETSVADIYAAGDCVQAVDVSSGESKVMALLPN